MDDQRKTLAPSHSGASALDHQTFFHLGKQYRTPSEDEDDERLMDSDDRPKWWQRCCPRFSCRRALRALVPGLTWVFMVAAILLVSLVLILESAPREGWSIVVPYVVYSVISLAIFLVWLIARMIWMAGIRRSFVESRFSVALSAIIDPELTYFCATVTQTLFWAYLPATGFHGRLLSEVLGLDKISREAFRVLLKTNLFLVLWAIRDLLLSMIVFKFLTRLLMTLNGNLLKYLMRYRLLRKLNAAWLQLYPLALDPSLPEEEHDHHDGGAGAFRNLHRSLQHNQAFRRFMNPSDAIGSRKFTHYLFAGKKRDTKTEALRRLAQTSSLDAVNYTADGLPHVLSRSNIEQTRRSGVENLLTIEYCRQYPPMIFIKDTEYKLTEKKLARDVGGLLFDHIVELRDALAPSEKNQDERDRFAHQTLVAMKQSARELGSIEAKATLAGVRRRRATTPQILRPPGANVAVPSGSVDMDTELVQEAYFQADPQLEASRPEPTREFSRDSWTVDLSSLLEIPWDDPRIPGVDPRSDVSDHDDLDQDVEDDDPYPTIQWRDAFEHNKDALAAELELRTREANLPSVYLTRDFLSILLENDIDQFMEFADPGGRGYVTKRLFVRLVNDVYRLRKQLVHLVASQEALKNIVSRAISFALIFLLLLIFLLITGVKPDTIIISGAAVISSLTVILSFLYTGFVQAVIFVCFVNPYNVGDRIVIDGRVRTVKKINMYFTEFYSMQWQIETLNHDTLFTKLIRNDTRCVHAGLELPFSIEYSTPQSKYEALHYLVEQYVQNHQEFVKDSFFCILNEFVIDHYIKFTYWITVVDSWGDWKSVYNTKAVLVRFINRQCAALGLNYTEPIQPVQLGPQHAISQDAYG